MNRRQFLKVTGGSLFFLGVGGCGEGERTSASDIKQTQPNILLVMVDDMGFSDLGCYGGEIDTPNVDKLAEDGVRFTQFYNTGRCCPTRASLLTGLYAHKTGMGWMTASNLGTPGYTGDLNENCVTIAQVLKPAGYRCYVSGKWHVTHDKYMGADGPKHNWPLQRGFDRFHGSLTGGGSYYKPKALTLDNKRIKVPKDFYYTDATAEYAVKFINDHYKKHSKKPFFLYTAFYAPHRPLHAKPEDIAKYKGKYMVGWDKVRAERYKRQLEMGLIDDKWKLSARDKKVPAWKDVPESERALWDMRMATYAAQIDCMDQGVGKILKTLQRNGALENTVVIFLSDNGGCAEPAGKGDIEVIGTAKTDESYRKAWANASDTPFRRYKQEVHEGGIATPLIIRWPEGIKVGRGSFCHTVGHVIDIMPTCVGLAGAEYPAKYNGKEINACAGKSLIPVFSGKDVPREALYFEHQADRAIRAGKWKLVSRGTSKKPYAGPWELYDLENDRTELNDLLEQEPAIAKKLKEMWHDWAVDNNVYPLDNRGWNVRVKADVTKGKRP